MLLEGDVDRCGRLADQSIDATSGTDSCRATSTDVPDGGTEEVVVGGKLVRLTSGTSVEVTRQESVPDVASID